MSQDFVAQLPDELAVIEKTEGKLPENVEFASHYYCRWGDRYFIHTRATLPLRDFDEGVGFGLWVEIAKEDFDAYLAAENDDESYSRFKVNGTLANEWPGFLDMMGADVVVRTVRVDEKVYITEVLGTEARDPLFDYAMSLPSGDPAAREKIMELVTAYVEDGSIGSND